TDLNEALPGLLPEGVAGDVFAAPLGHAEAPAVLLLVARPPNRFGPEHDALLNALIELFTAAWVNHCRLRDLHVLGAGGEGDKASLLAKVGREDVTGTIVGAQSGLRQVMKQVGRVAGSDVPVLIFGETGSGKEVIARAIHTRSRCAAGAFLRVNCGA